MKVEEHELLTKRMALRKALDELEVELRGGKHKESMGRHPIDEINRVHEKYSGRVNDDIVVMLLSGNNFDSNIEVARLLTTLLDKMEKGEVSASSVREEVSRLIKSKTRVILDDCR